MKISTIILFLMFWCGVECAAAGGVTPPGECDSLSRKEARAGSRSQRELERVARQREKMERRNGRDTLPCGVKGADAAPRAARMVLPVSSHNFGDIRRKGGDLVHEFTFRNEGTAPLVLIRVITSCHCLRATFPKRPVAPGGEGTIRIVYEPNKSEEGMFSKVIQIYSNSVGGREIITVQGNSIDGELPRSGSRGRKNKN